MCVPHCLLLSGLCASSMVVMGFCACITTVTLTCSLQGLLCFHACALQHAIATYIMLQYCTAFVSCNCLWSAFRAAPERPLLYDLCSGLLCRPLFLLDVRFQLLRLNSDANYWDLTESSRSRASVCCVPGGCLPVPEPCFAEIRNHDQDRCSVCFYRYTC